MGAAGCWLCPVRCWGVPPAAGRRKGRRPGQRLKDGSIGQANAQAATQQQAQQQVSANAQAEQTAQGDVSALQGAADFSSEPGQHVIRHEHDSQ